MGAGWGGDGEADPQQMAKKRGENPYLIVNNLNMAEFFPQVTLAFTQRL